ncbi:MAG: hypothetical protein V3R95_06645 [Dehalococcoidia bacterium]
MTRSLKAPLLLAAAAVLLIAAACGGDGDAGPEPASIEDLNAFRYEMVMELSGSAANFGDSDSGGLSLNIDLEFSIEMSGAVIRPDREQTMIKADFGFIKLEAETIRVGDRVWGRELGGDWEEQTGSGTLDELGLAFNPLDILGDSTSADGLSALRAALAAFAGSDETVNGIASVRYELTSEQFSALFPDTGDGESSLPTDDLDEVSISLWVARASGIPVRVLIEGSSAGDDGEGAVRLELNLSDFNSGSIEIEPPI